MTTLLLIIFILVMVCVESIYIKQGLDRIYYENEVSQSLVEPDEDFIIRSVIENHKPWFIPYVGMTEHLPYDIQIPGEEENLSRDSSGANVYVSSSTNSFQREVNSHLKSTFYIMPNQKIVREVHASLPRRGQFLLNGCFLYGGDFLGLADSVKTFPMKKEIIVMPKRCDMPETEKLVGDFLGEISVNRFIFEDPMLTIGFSEYSGREPMRDISWVQSARMGRMMVKNYDHTVDLSVDILLNVQSLSNIFENEELVERCISMTRSLCEMLEDKRIKYSFTTNAVPAGTMRYYASIEQGLGNRHFYTIMETLGRATTIGSEPFASTISRSCRKGESGRYQVIITPNENPAWEQELHLLRKLSEGRVILFTPPQTQNEKEEETA